MLGSTHFVAGVAIGRLTGNPLLAAVLGFLSHIVMDFIPHWNGDYPSARSAKSFTPVILDMFITALFIFWLIFGNHFEFNVLVNMLVGGFFAALPDVILVLIKLFKIEKLRFLLAFNTRIVHWFLKQEDKDFDEFAYRTYKKGTQSFREVFFGLLYQVPFVLVSFWFLLK